MSIALGELLGKVHDIVLAELKHKETRKHLRQLLHDDHLYLEEYAEGESSASITITNPATKDVFLVHTIIAQCDGSTATLKLGRKTFTLAQGTVEVSNLQAKLNASDERSLTSTNATSGRMRLFITGRVIDTPLAMTER